MRCEICDYNPKLDSLYRNGTTGHANSGVVRYRPKYDKVLCTYCTSTIRDTTADSEFNCTGDWSEDHGLFTSSKEKENEL